MSEMQKLIEYFSHFPGIGPRQARRFAYYMMSKPTAVIEEFTAVLKRARSQVTHCELCQRMFSNELNSKQSICHTCDRADREQGTLLIVSRDSDFESIEKSGAYSGLYFILGGSVPILDREPEKRIKLRLLLERVRSAKTPFHEIILSMSTTPEGENTTAIVRKALEHIIKASGTTTSITVLGRGLSTGAELEYADKETIKNALSNRG